MVANTSGIRSILFGESRREASRNRHRSLPTLARAAVVAASTLLVMAGSLSVAPHATASDHSAGGRGAKARSPDRNGYPTKDIQLTDVGRVSYVRMVVDKSQTLRTDVAFAEVLVANPDIADIVPLTDRSVYVIGKRIGVTRLTVLGREKRLLGVVELEVSYDSGALRAELQRSVPSGEFRLTTANGRIVMSGMVPDGIALAKAVDLAEQFTAGCDGAASSGAPAVAGAGAAQRPATGKCYVNSLIVRAPQQVLLEVRFVEAQRNAGRHLGLSWDSTSNRFRGITGGQSTTPLTGTGSAGIVNPVTGSLNGVLDMLAAPAAMAGFPAGAAIPFGTFVARVLDNGTRADLVVQALESRGLARRLAEPNLVTLSGDTANFLAGGEFPFPVQADDRRITIEFKKFGVGLAFTPTVLAGGQINLKIEPEVSDLDPVNTLRINDIEIPSLVVRRANTTVELRDGQSFAVAGLLQTKHSKNQRQLPWLGQVPVLGALFRSASYEKEESDLVIIVTPRLVRPATPGQKLMTPHDGALASNDRDFFLHGRQEIPNHKPVGYGHMLELKGAWSTDIQREAGDGPFK